jgi:hypothetical protein
MSGVDGLLRTLGEQTDKLTTALRDLGRAHWNGGLLVTGTTMGTTAFYVGGHAPVWLPPVVGILAGCVWRFAAAPRRIAAQLAAWRLRRVYELASRVEDLGRDLDAHERLELELRLSEAQFLLIRAGRLGEPRSKVARMVLRQGIELPQSR